MAVTYVSLGAVPPVADLGQNGYELIRLTLDGTVTSKAITLDANSRIKTILGCVGASASHNIPAAGVAATTGFTAKFAAGTNAEFLDLLVYGQGR